MQIASWLKTGGGFLLATLLFFFIFGLGHSCGESSRQQEVDSLIRSLSDESALVEVARNRSIDLKMLLSEQKEMNRELASTIAKLKDRPAEIRYIVRTETVIQPEKPEQKFEELPQHYKHILENGVVVAEFDQTDTPPRFRFQTHKIGFRGTLAIGRKTTAALLQMQSSHDPESWVDVEVDLETIALNERRLVEPFANLGFSAGVGGLNGIVTPDFTASIYLSWLHPVDCLDTLNVRASANNRALKFGLDPVSYNIGCHVKGLSDLWIGAGASVDIFGIPSGELTIGTRL